MSRLTYVQEQVINTILHEPNKIRRLLANSNNPGYIVSFLRDIWPIRVGVEIDTECKLDLKAPLNLFESKINAKYSEILGFNPIILDRYTKQSSECSKYAEIRVSVRGFIIFILLKNLLIYSIKRKIFGLH